MIDRASFEKPACRCRVASLPLLAPPARAIVARRVVVQGVIVVVVIVRWHVTGAMVEYIPVVVVARRCVDAMDALAMPWRRDRACSRASVAFLRARSYSHTYSRRYIYMYACV